MPRERDIEGRPAFANRGGLIPQSRLHIRPDAIHVDVQLILRAANIGVDRQADVLARQLAAQRGVDVGARIPGLGKIIRRIGSQDRRALDSGDARGGNQQKLRVAPDVLEDRESLIDSAVEIHPDAWHGIVLLQFVGDAFIVDHDPKHVARGELLLRRGDEAHKRGANRKRGCESSKQRDPGHTRHIEIVPRAPALRIIA